MAFTKNPLTDGEKQKLSVYSNDLENRIENGFFDFFPFEMQTYRISGGGISTYEIARNTVYIVTIQREVNNNASSWIVSNVTGSQINPPNLTLAAGGECTLSNDIITVNRDRHYRISYMRIL